MKFAKFPVVSPRLERILEEKKAEELDWKEVEAFQEREMKENERLNFKKFRAENPVTGFLLAHPNIVMSLLVLCCIVSLGSAFQSAYFVLSSVIFFVICFSFLLWVARNEVRLQSQKWQRSPFEVFRSEYKGKVAGNICNCVDTHCISPLLELTVEHHTYSSVRFLIVRDPDEENGDSYYVDYWDVDDMENQPASV